MSASVCEGNPYRPSGVCGWRTCRYFPLLIRYRFVLGELVRGAELLDVLKGWARSHGYHFSVRTDTCWTLTRSCNWRAWFAWRIRHIPTRIYCRYVPRQEGWIIRLVCRHDWAVALPGDPVHLRRELEQLVESVCGGTASRTLPFEHTFS